MGAVNLKTVEWAYVELEILVTSCPEARWSSEVGLTRKQVVYWHLIGVGAGHQLFSATHSIEAKGKLEQRGHQGPQDEGGREREHDQGRPSIRVRPVCLCCRSGGFFCHARQWTIGEDSGDKRPEGQKKPYPR